MFEIILHLTIGFSSLDACIKNDTIHLLVAETYYERTEGLMYVQSLAQDSGMLFVFEKPQTLHFWMKNTLVPLDIAFLNKNFVIMDIKKGVPLDTTPITSPDGCMYAVEMNEGFFKKHHIFKGDTLRIIK